MGKRSPNLRSSIYYSDSDGYWHGWVVMGVKNDGSIDRRHRMAKTEGEVTEKVRKLEAQRDSGKPSKPGRPPTVAEWMNEYLGKVCVRLVSSGKMSPRTLDDYRSKSRNWIVPLLGRHRLNRLLPEHLDAAYQVMYDEGLSSSTVLKIHRILSRALKVAMRRDKVGRNVATLIDAPEAEEPETEALTQEEARRILETAADRRNGARWTVALALGIRQGEALGLRWKYVNLDTGVIQAWFQLQRAEWQHGCDDPKECARRWHQSPCREECKKHQHEKACPAGCKKKSHRCPKRTCDPKSCESHADRCPQRKGGELKFRPRKGKKRLTLQCPPELLPILKAHRKAQNAERLKAGDKWEDWDLVFCLRNGRPNTRTEDWREWKTILREANVRDARLHDARHTCGTLLVEQGVHIRVVQEILGHARVTTTERYTHVASPQVQDATERIGTALWGT